MEAIYENLEPKTHVCQLSVSTPPASTKSNRGFLFGVITFMVILSVLLLAGLIIFGFFYGDAVRNFSAISDRKDNLTDHLNAVIESLNSSLTETTKELMECKQNGDAVRNRKDNLIDHLNAVIERLNSSLIETTKELMEYKQRKTRCPEEWMGFDSSCYFLFEESKSWDEARRFCRAREADLVVINNRDENAFLLAFTKRSVWIGLSDKAEEGTWKWVDGSPLTLKFWRNDQPDNGAGKYGEEDCALFRFEGSDSWNDISCKTSLRWICEKKAK